MKKSLIVLISILALLVIIIGYGISINNKMVNADEAVMSQWAKVENQYQRRADLIPNLVSTVKSYTKHETEVVDRVLEARDQLMNADTVEEKSEADQQMDSALSGLKVVVENYPELKNLFHKSLKLVGCAGVCLAILANLLSAPLASLFVGYDDALFALTIHGFRIYSLAFLLNGFSIFGSAFFTALNNGLISACIAFLRTFAFQIVAVLVLPYLFGINGVWCSIVVAESLAICVTISFFVRKRHVYHYA